MKQILIINGPNLNLLGIREPEKYGNMGFDPYLETLRTQFPECEITYYQSNHEGCLIDKIHEAGFTADGIVLNAGGYTHTSVAIRDAIAAVSTPVVEVHVSNVYTREDFRCRSLLSGVCKGVITGFGMDSYRLGIESLRWLKN